MNTTLANTISELSFLLEQARKLHQELIIANDNNNQQQVEALFNTFFSLRSQIEGTLETLAEQLPSKTTEQRGKRLIVRQSQVTLKRSNNYVNFEGVLERAIHFAEEAIQQQQQQEQEKQQQQEQQQRQQRLRPRLLRRVWNKLTRAN